MLSMFYFYYYGPNKLGARISFSCSSKTSPFNEDAMILWAYFILLSLYQHFLIDWTRHVQYLPYSLNLRQRSLGEADSASHHNLTAALNLSIGPIALPT